MDFKSRLTICKARLESKGLGTTAIKGARLFGILKGREGSGGTRGDKRSVVGWEPRRRGVPPLGE